MTTEEVAKILRATATPEGEFDTNVVRLVQEFDRLRWELSGWKARCDMARQERDDIASRYWTLQMTKVKGGAV